MEGLDMNVAFWQDRPVFITGATGLVGSWLVKSTEDGFESFCLPSFMKPYRSGCLFP